MFCELFGVPQLPVAKAEPGKHSQAKPPKAKPAKKKAPKKPKTIVPMVMDQLGAPFEHTIEDSPEPADIDQLEYESLELPTNDEWMEEEIQLPEELTDDEDNDNYEATSMTEDCDEVCGSIGSTSPGFFEKKIVKIEKLRPPGIAVTFDDDSWIL